jgi:hypothetical protein
MSCSPWIAFLLLLFGVGCSVGTGVALAYTSKNTSLLTQALINKNASQYEAAFNAAPGLLFYFFYSALAVP